MNAMLFMEQNKKVAGNDEKYAAFLRIYESAISFPFKLTNMNRIGVHDHLPNQVKSVNRQNYGNNDGINCTPAFPIEVKVRQRPT